MRFFPWLSSIFNPEYFQDLHVDSLGAALNDSGVRRHWLSSVLDEIKETNLRVHAALTNGNLTDQFVRESAKLQGIVWVLQQILNSKTSVDIERNHNPSDNAPQGLEGV